MTIQNDELYEILWTSAYLAVHRYGGNPSGEVLLVMTILMLDQVDQHVTMSELAQITGLPKSNVSRYVSDQLKTGHLTEEIDPADRRRRVLLPTAAGREEQKWHQDRLLRLTKLKNAAQGQPGGNVDLVATLMELTESLRDENELAAAPG